MGCYTAKSNVPEPAVATVVGHVYPPPQAAVATVVGHVCPPPQAAVATVVGHVCPPPQAEVAAKRALDSEQALAALEAHCSSVLAPPKAADKPSPDFDEAACEAEYVEAVSKVKEELAAIGFARTYEDWFCGSADNGVAFTSNWLANGGAELEPLFGCTTVLDLQWIRNFAERGEKMHAWQQLPTEAEVDHKQLIIGSRKQGVLPVGVLSYGWAAKRHPDPTGHLLQCLSSALLQYSGSWGIGDSTFGLVWDFPSLPQRGYTAGYDQLVEDRTPEQMARFRRGLFHINVWYGAEFVLTFVFNVPLPADAENQAEYGRRGWCIFEKQLSSLVKFSKCYVDLGKMSQDAQGKDRFHAMTRPAPISPDTFEKMMIDGIAREKEAPGTGIKFTNGKDLTDVVIPQYKRAFLKLWSSAEGLGYSHLGWGDDEACDLATALAYAHQHGCLQQLSSMSLFGNHIHDRGILAIANLIRVGAMPSLRSIWFEQSTVSKDAQSLVQTLSEQKGFRVMWKNSFSSAG